LGVGPILIAASGGCQVIKQFVKSLPYISNLHDEIAHLKAELKRWRTWMPPGHFYSPIPALEEVRSDADRIFQFPSDRLLDIDLKVEKQLELLRQFGAYQTELPVAWMKQGAARYCYENEYYSWADAIVLHAMLRKYQPKRIVEIGSGFSSAVILDTSDIFFDTPIDCTFIDPYPDRLRSLLRTEDAAHVRILAQRVQDVDLQTFTALAPGDFLIVDSSHVSKTGSDFNHILFEIVPRLQPGVHLHFHDVFFPFEYPRAWAEVGIAWNEAYVLRAFLQNNNAFEITFFTSYLLSVQRAAVEASLPWMLRSEREHLSVTDAPGSSLWLKRVA